MLVTRRSFGFTLVELLVALTLTGLVSTVALGLLRMTLVGHRRLIEYVESSYALRTSVQVLRSQILELDAGDSGGGDILDMGRGFIEYRRMAALLFLCADGDTSTGRVSAFSHDSLSFGDDGLIPMPGRDDVLVLSTGNHSSLSEARWFASRLTDVAGPSACPGNTQGLSLATPDLPVALLRFGAPMRIIQRYRLRVYADAQGQWWIGSQQRSSTGAWSIIQPVVGPLVASGLQLMYFDQVGASTNDPARVARVRVEVVAGGRAGNRTRRFRADIALRNNPRP